MFFVEREFNGRLEELIDSLIFYLKNGGYVIVADIDIKGILKKALNFDFKQYHIFEICRPQAAKELVGGDDSNGLFLPCKMTVFESNGKIKVRILLSSMMAQEFHSEAVAGIKKYEDDLIRLFNSFTP
ncbi:MAG: DUF302 domain-containing protein [Thermoplasmatales archaeon]